MTRSILSLTLLALLGLASAPALHAQATRPAATAPAGNAAQSAPSRMVLESSSRILQTLEARRAEFSRDRSALRGFVKNEFNQLFDHQYTASLVLGRHARGASEADIRQFSEALTDNLASRYSDTLLGFNTSFRVRIKSETPLPNNRGVRVSTELVRSGGAPVAVDFLLRRVGNQWKAFDVIAEGISSVQFFRNQFDPALSQRGIRAVSNDLKTGKMQAQANVGG